MAPLITFEVGRFRLRLYPTALSETYWLSRGDHRFDHEFLERYLRPGDAVVDVGANIGSLSLDSAALVGDAGRVIAFEAHPGTYGYLRGNIALNRVRNVTTHRVALGASSGEVRFSDTGSDDQNAVDATGGIRVPLAPWTRSSLT